MSWRFLGTSALVGGIVAGLLLPRVSQAVMPPDFIFNIGAQLAQFVAVVAVFVSAAFGVISHYVRIYVLTPGRRRVFFVVGLLSLIVIIGGSAWWYRGYAQRQAYNDWLAQSSQHEMTAPVPEAQQIDKLAVETTPQDIPMPDKVFVGYGDGAVDSLQQFINDYYRAIAEHRFSAAYAMSKKAVNQATFTSWYTGVTRISLDKYTAIDNDTASLQLTLVEGKVVTRYGVLMTIAFDASNKPVSVASSEVRVLSTENTDATVVPVVENTPTVPSATTATFFEQHRNDSFTISNDDFKQAVAKGEVLVLDAREDIEYALGNYPDSMHIRFADLRAGRWIELPQDKVIYVFCWSGIRGEEVARFLRTKQIFAQALNDGASGWKHAGGTWNGDIYFLNEYTDAAYKKLFITSEVKQLQADGVVIVDSRQPEKFLASPIPGSVNIPLMYTSTAALEATFAQVPPGSRVITVCDDYVNCFDARLTGAELVKRGHTFLGRYNEPWKYGK